MEKTALYYLYGMPEEDIRKYEGNDIEETSLFEDPDVCSCGGVIRWNRAKWNSLTIIGVCTSCGKEVTRSEE